MLQSSHMETVESIKNSAFSVAHSFDGDLTKDHDCLHPNAEQRSLESLATLGCPRTFVSVCDLSVFAGTSVLSVHVFELVSNVKLLHLLSLEDMQVEQHCFKGRKLYELSCSLCPLLRVHVSMPE